MKCVMMQDGSIERMSNEDARGMVMFGNCQYAPKARWKEQQRKDGLRVDAVPVIDALPKLGKNARKKKERRNAHKV